MTTYKTLPEDELIRLLKDDNTSAFTELYNRFWKILYYTAHNIIQEPNAAKDVVQEVFISLWQRRAEVEIKSVKAYLQQATRFQVLKVIRSGKTGEQFYQRLAIITEEIIADDPLLFKELQASLNNLLDNLPEGCSEAFRLSREENYTYKQIASQLNISEKTVEKRLSKCLKFLRANLEYEMCILSFLANYYFIN